MVFFIERGFANVSHRSLLWEKSGAGFDWRSQCYDRGNGASSEWTNIIRAAAHSRRWDRRCWWLLRRQTDTSRRGGYFVESQNGAVVRMAREVGIDVPTHDLIYRTLRPLEQEVRRTTDC